jgi:hypothetical protein
VGFHEHSIKDRRRLGCFRVCLAENDINCKIDFLDILEVEPLRFRYLSMSRKQIELLLNTHALWRGPFGR